MSETKIKLTGKVVQVDEKSGTTTKGDWRRQTVVIETDAKYDNFYPVGFFNKNVECQKGDTVEATAYVNGREYQGKYYPDINGETLKVTSGAMVSHPDAAVPSIPLNDNDDLPF